jgi:hypothetical protein
MSRLGFLSVDQHKRLTGRLHSKGIGINGFRYLAGIKLKTPPLADVTEDRLPDQKLVHPKLSATHIFDQGTTHKAHKAVPTVADDSASAT